MGKAKGIRHQKEKENTSKKKRDYDKKKTKRKRILEGEGGAVYEIKCEGENGKGHMERSKKKC